MARPKASAAARFAEIVKEIGMNESQMLLDFLKRYNKKSPKTDPDLGALGEDVQLGGESKPTPTE